MICPRCWGSRHEPGGDLNACLRCGGLGEATDSLLGPDFRLSEFLISQTAIRRGIPNDPPGEALGNLCVLIRALESFRPATGPLHVDSGYRSRSLNIAIGGAPNSAHVLGCAADLIPRVISHRDLFDLICKCGVAFDQLIWEYGAWIHFGVCGPGGVQRGERLMIFSSGGYEPFDPNDPRVR